MYTETLLSTAATLRRNYEDVDWTTTTVGPIESWNPTLRGAVDLMLNTQFPVTLFWGPEFVLLYNEAFVPLIADKHPSALGTPAREVFPEAWDTIGPMMQSVLAGHGATWVEDASVPLERRGFIEEAFFTFSYSPVRNTAGEIEGVMDIAAETTRQVIGRRRFQMLSELRASLAALERAEDLDALALPVLEANAADLPGVELREGAPADGKVGFPFGTGSRPLVLAVRIGESLARDAGYMEFLQLIATVLGQAIDRVREHQAERSFAEALQRSLLSQPLQPEHVQVAVRYLPATQQEWVGGDWYDAFLDREGRLTVAVGDVTGHDQLAAAGMAQIRNLLRGIAHTLRASPAGVMDTLDEAVHGLRIGTYATAILARLEADAKTTLRWTNAGHPPPILLTPDGAARMLDTRPEILLGLGLGGHVDHVVELEPHTSVVLYTDGLVERRDTQLQERLEWLVGTLAGRHDLDAEALCDHVLAQLDDDVEDDVALLVLRVLP